MLERPQRFNMLREGRVLEMDTVMAPVEIQLAVDVPLSIIEWPRLLKQLQLPPSLPKQGQTDLRNTRISRPDQNLHPQLLKLKCNVRIAEPQILPFGDEMKTANPSVMHAVLPFSL